MIDTFKRLREPLIWALLALVAAGIVHAGVSWALLVASGETPFAASRVVGDGVLHLTAVIALIAVVVAGAYFEPPLRRVRLLTGLAALLVGIGAVLTAVAAGLGAVDAGGSLGATVQIVGGLLDVAIKVIAAVLLWTMSRSASSPTQPADPKPALPPAAPSVSGTAWRTAGDAAAGRPGLSSLTAPESPEQGTAPDSTSGL